VGSSISGHGTAQEQVVREQSAMCAPSLLLRVSPPSPYSLPDTFFNSHLYFLSPFLFYYILYFILSLLLVLLCFIFSYSSLFLMLFILFLQFLSSVFCIFHSSSSYIFSPLSLFRKYKNRLMRLQCCLCVCVSSLFTFECPNQSL
jgi:hypothetical protein